MDARREKTDKIESFLLYFHRTLLAIFSFYFRIFKTLIPQRFHTALALSLSRVSASPANNNPRLLCKLEAPTEANYLIPLCQVASFQHVTENMQMQAMVRPIQNVS